MGLNCGLSTIKYVLFVFNLLCSLCGIALVVIGGVSLSKIADLQNISDEHSIVAPSILFIILGSVVFVIAFFGCCGAIRESYCMTSTYGFFLMVLIIAQIVIAALVFIYVGDAREAFKKGFAKLFVWLSRWQHPNGRKPKPKSSPKIATLIQMVLISIATRRPTASVDKSREH